MATVATRKYPRLSIEITGALELRVTTPPEPGPGRSRTTGQSELVRVPVDIRSISCEGAGVAFRQGRLPVTRGDSATLHFVVEGRRFELPGRVAWALPPRDAPAPMDLGLHFRLELAGQSTRQAWGLWIVSLISATRRNDPTATRGT